MRVRFPLLAPKFSKLKMRVQARPAVYDSHWLRLRSASTAYPGLAERSRSHPHREDVSYAIEHGYSSNFPIKSGCRFTCNPRFRLMTLFLALSTRELQLSDQMGLHLFFGDESHKLSIGTNHDQELQSPCSDTLQGFFQRLTR
jgi:hypothetical protein